MIEAIRNPVKCGPRPRLTPGQIVICKRVHMARQQWAERYKLPPRMSGQPSNAELAQQFGVPLHVVKRAMGWRHFGWALRWVR